MTVIIIPDALESLDRDHPYGVWPTDNWQGDLDAYLRASERDLLELPSINECLSVVVAAGLGRHLALGLAGPVWTPLLTVSAEQLSYITELERANSLALLQFAKARDRLSSSTQVIAASSFDVFGFFEEHGKSFYLSDEALPSILSISPGWALNIRKKVARRVDAHAAPSWNRGFIVEVRRLYEGTQAPVYVPLGLDSEVRILVEVNGLAIWVCSPDFSAGQPHNAAASICMQLADVIAYWLWQAAPFIKEALEATLDAESMVVRFQLQQPQEWSRDAGLAGFSDDKPLIAATRKDDDIEVSVPSLLRRDLMRSDNLGERELLRTILDEMNELCRERSGGQAGIDVSGVIESIAPIGSKKKLVLVSSAVVPTADDTGIGPVRLVQDAETEAVLDELGSAASTRVHAPVGTVANEQRTQVLNAAVAYCYEEVEALVKTLDPRGLLEALMDPYESLVHDGATRELTIPTQLQCFSSEDELIQELVQEIPKRTVSAIANRFLVEYVAARPPSGLRPPSQSVLDRLMAFAGVITNFGFFSDFLMFGLADADISILPSGRVGLERDKLTSAMDQYLPVMARTGINYAQSRFTQHWQTGKHESNSSSFPELERATRAEFGVSVIDMAQLAIEAIGLGSEGDIRRPTAQMPKSEFLALMASALDWSKEHVDKCLAQLALGARSEFLKPPSGDRSDAWPWRFSRRWSYARRPLVIRGAAEEQEVLWGPRHTYEAGRYLLAECEGGRIKAESQEMKNYVSRVVNREGRAFNDEVAREYERRPRHVVRSRVERVNGEFGRLEPPGDIDVLVADISRGRLRVVECKTLELARSASEMSNQMKSLFIGSTSKPAAVERLRGRVNWTKENLQPVLEWLDVPRDRRWTVRGQIVVDVMPIASYMARSPYRVLTLSQLREQT